MGSYGSGRYSDYGKRRTVEESLTLDVGELRRRGIVEPGVCRSGRLEWSSGGRVTDSVGYVIDLRPGSEQGRGLVLQYWAGRGELAKSVEYQVRLVTTVPRFGGVRWWFLCPLDVGGRMCGRRVAKIHLPPGAHYFGCRQCHGLTYQSCQESRKWDALFASLAAETGYHPKFIRWVLKPR